MTLKGKGKNVGKRSVGELKAHDPERLAAYHEHRQKLEDAGVIPPVDPRLRPTQPKKTPNNVAVFLEHIAKGWSVAVAASLIGARRQTIKSWKETDADFAALYEEAQEAGVDFIEQEARRRAVEGTDEPVFQQGECVGFKRNYSDSLMQMMLAGRRPERYGKQRHEVSGPGGQPIKYDVEVSFVTSQASKE